MNERALRTAHERFRAALLGQGCGGYPPHPAEPADQPPAEPATTTLHRPNCTRPGWQLAPCLSPSGCQIARCIDATCGAVELRTTDKETHQ
jgi:hypothetical protein